MEERKVELSGTVIREPVDALSKSEREAVLLRTEDGRKFVLRKLDEPAFGKSGLDDLVGLSITTRGVAIDQTLIVQDWKIEE